MRRQVQGHDFTQNVFRVPHIVSSDKSRRQIGEASLGLCRGQTTIKPILDLVIRLDKEGGVIASAGGQYD